MTFGTLFFRMICFRTLTVWTVLCLLDCLLMFNFLSTKPFFCDGLTYDAKSSFPGAFNKIKKIRKWPPFPVLLTKSRKTWQVWNFAKYQNKSSRPNYSSHQSEVADNLLTAFGPQQGRLEAWSLYLCCPLLAASLPKVAPLLQVS